MTTERLKLRPATAADCDQVFAWVNDPDTRRMAFNSEAIPYPVHRKWYSETLRSQQRQLFIVEFDASAVGVLRLDRAPAARDQAEISINIAPDWRRQGLAVPILSQAAELSRQLGMNRLRARIRPDNSASIRAFQKAGFVQVRPSELVEGPALCFELRMK